ncbi:MAG TPA: hypothetical protein VGE26_07230 [Sphingobacteriaceae bacterium]
MSQNFKLEFEENKETTSARAESQDPDKYFQAGNIRTITFQWPNGSEQFFNYSYLVTCKYDIEQKKIVFHFTSHKIELSGFKLHLLMKELAFQLPKTIRCEDERYADLKKDKEISIVTKIEITELKENAS